MNSLMMIFLVLSPNLIQIMALDKTETAIENANQDEKLSCFIYANIDMYIASHLPEQGQPLTFHCGANNDVNAHSLTLSPNHHFHFHFCMRPFAEFYFCSTFWGDKTAAFVVYSKSNNYCDGKTCYWSAQSDGIYFGTGYPPNGLTKIRDWESRKQVVDSGKNITHAIISAQQKIN